MSNLFLLGIVIFLLVISALVSSSEIAFFSFKASDLAEFKQSKDKRENRIYQLGNQPRYLLATILIVNNFVNIGIIIVSFYLLSNIFDFSLVDSAIDAWLGQHGWPQFIHHDFSVYAEVIVNTILVTFFIVIFGEVIPKVYASQHPRSLARFIAKPLFISKRLLLPLSKLLTKTSEHLEHRLLDNNETISVEEVDMAIDLTTKGKATEEEVNMLKSIVRFGEISVKDVMTSRPDILAANKQMPYTEIIQLIRKSGYSRIPVYEEKLDNILGILYTKDLLAYLNEEPNFDWVALIRQPFFTPENKKIDDLLEDFQSNHMHLAIVVDEYGGTAGLITLEDVLEEIVGEINDEFDDLNDVVYEKINDHHYIFEGKVSLFDMCKIMKEEYSTLDTIKGDADSLAGLILEIAGIIPRKNQKIFCKHLIFTILESDNKRIKKVDVERKIV